MQISGTVQISEERDGELDSETRDYFERMLQEKFTKALGESLRYFGLNGQGQTPVFVFGLDYEPETVPLQTCGE